MSDCTFNYGNGAGSVGSFQMAGLPFITGSLLAVGAEDHITFPRLSKSLTIINNAAADIRIHFRSQDYSNVISGKHYVSLTENRDSITMNMRCTEVYISNADLTNSGSYTVIAELTGISREQFPYPLTGSGIDA